MAVKTTVADGIKPHYWAIVEKCGGARRVRITDPSAAIFRIVAL